MTQISRPDLLVIDTETSGTSVSRGHEAIQVAGIRLDGNTLIEKASFVSWVRPQNPEAANPYALAVSGATLARLAFAPKVTEVVPRLREALGLLPGQGAPSSCRQGQERQIPYGRGYHGQVTHQQGPRVVPAAGTPVLSDLVRMTGQLDGRTENRQEVENGQVLKNKQMPAPGLDHERGLPGELSGSMLGLASGGLAGGLGNNHERSCLPESENRQDDVLAFDPRPVVVVAHSLPFDRPFWDDMFRRGGVVEGFPLGSVGMCSLRWLRSVRARIDIAPTQWDARTGRTKASDKLADWAQAVGLSQPSTHDALEDVRLLAEVLRRIRARLPYEVWL